MPDRSGTRRRACHAAVPDAVLWATGEGRQRIIATLPCRPGAVEAEAATGAGVTTVALLWDGAIGKPRCTARAAHTGERTLQLGGVR
jgi:hypothetical protein